MKKYSNKSNDGYAILFTVLVVSLVLAMALGIANVSYTESVFSTQARDSHIAFFAADTGLECGLYFERMNGSQFYTGNSFNTTDTASFACSNDNTNQPILITASPTPPNQTTDPIVFNFVDSNNTPGIPVGNGCASLTVTENYPNPVLNGPPGTKIVAKGYNVPVITGSSSAISPRLISRLRK